MRPLGEQKKVYKVRKKLSREIFYFCINRINRFLAFTTLKSKRKYWGIVYDSVSKQPLDPAIVKLVYADEDMTTQTCVTDLGGRYGFLARPGKFKVLAKKTNYSFPSKIVKGDSDGLYDHLYHGEFFELEDDYEVIAPNIPMDPIKADWNQSAKQSKYGTHPYWEYYFKKIIAILFWFGFIFSCVYVRKYSIEETLVPYIALGSYTALFLLAVITPEEKLWGELRQKNLYDSELYLELHSAELGDIVFGKTRVLPGGKFFLRANPGKYDLVIKGLEKEGEK